MYVLQTACSFRWEATAVVAAYKGCNTLHPCNRARHCMIVEVSGVTRSCKVVVCLPGTAGTQGVQVNRQQTWLVSECALVKEGRVNLVAVWLSLHPQRGVGHTCNLCSRSQTHKVGLQPLQRVSDAHSGLRHACHLCSSCTDAALERCQAIAHVQPVLQHGAQRCIHLATQGLHLICTRPGGCACMGKQSWLGSFPETQLWQWQWRWQRTMYEACCACAESLWPSLLARNCQLPDAAAFESPGTMLFKQQTCRPHQLPPTLRELHTLLPQLPGAPHSQLAVPPWRYANWTPQPAKQHT